MFQRRDVPLNIVPEIHQFHQPALGFAGGYKYRLGVVCWPVLPKSTALITLPPYPRQALSRQPSGTTFAVASSETVCTSRGSLKILKMPRTGSSASQGTPSGYRPRDQQEPPRQSPPCSRRMPASSVCQLTTVQTLQLPWRGSLARVGAQLAHPAAILVVQLVSRCALEIKQVLQHPDRVFIYLPACRQGQLWVKYPLDVCYWDAFCDRGSTFPLRTL